MLTLLRFGAVPFRLVIKHVHVTFIQVFGFGAVPFRLVIKLETYLTSTIESFGAVPFRLVIKLRRFSLKGFRSFGAVPFRLVIKRYADFGSGFELKTTKKASSYNTINGHLKNASKKKNTKYVVFDNRGNESMSDEQLIKWLNESRTFRRGRVYIIDQQGNYRYIR